MHRFYLPPEQCLGTEFQLTGAEGHHALHVMRVRSGQRLNVADGAGHEFVCEAAETQRGGLRLRVLEKRRFEPPPCRVTLLQAVPKGKTIESIIQKATELGVSRIVPLLAERVVVRLNSREAGHKAEKWQAVAIEAMKQCGCPWLPKVAVPVTPAEATQGEAPPDLSLLASLQPNAVHPRRCFLDFLSRTGGMPRSIAVWIGPEGDFTGAEIAAIEASGAGPITLGPLVLRTETAALYCLSVVNYELQATSSRSICSSVLPLVSGTRK